MPKWGLTAVCLLAVSILAPVAHSDTRTFAKIADLNSPIPGGTGNFTSLFQPQVSHGNIVIGGNGAGGQRGYYRFDPATSTLSTIVNQGTPLPGAPSGESWETGPGVLTTVVEGGFAVYGPDIAFAALGPSEGRLMTTRGGLRRLTGARILSSGVGDPISMDDRSYLAGEYVPRMSFPAQSVLSYRQVAASGDITGQGPDLENVTKFLARGGRVSYVTRGRFAGTPGTYELHGTGGDFYFSNGASTVGPQPPSFRLPGETAGYTITASGSGIPPLFSDDGMTTVFRASASSDGTTPTRTALLAKSAGGNLTVIADTTAFSFFSNVTIDDGVVAFIGTSVSGPSGIFVTGGDGTFREIVAAGDTLDGKSIAGLTFSGDRPLSGQDLVFTALFTDGSKGLYLASVPEPAALALLACAAIPGLHRRRRRPARAI